MGLDGIIALGVIAEIGIMAAAAWVWFYQHGNTLAEAASYAIVSVLMALSFSLQVAYLLGFPMLSLLVEVLLTLFAVVTLLRRRQLLGKLATGVRNFAAEHPKATAAMGLCGGFLALQALVSPLTPVQWEVAAQVRTLPTIFGEDHLSLAASLAPLPPLNAPILTQLFLRFPTGYGVGLLGLMAYFSIAFSTYALARRYTWPPTAFTVAMIVISFPRLVYHATTAGHEILPAAVALFCVLAIYRVVERPHARDLGLLVLGIVFGISGGEMCLVFPVLLAVLSIMVLRRRYGGMSWWRLIKQSRGWGIALLAPLVVFSQSWLFLYNHLTAGQWVQGAHGNAIAYNSDALTGTLANMVRYGIENIDLLQPVEQFCLWALNFSAVHLLDAVVNRIAGGWLGSAGALQSFEIYWGTDPVRAWYGPFGFLLVGPAIVYAAWRGPRRLKAIAIGLLVYVYLCALIPAWQPGNAYLFAPLFACAGVCIAFMFPPWRFTAVQKGIFQAISTLLIVYAMLFNAVRPVFG